MSAKLSNNFYPILDGNKESQTGLQPLDHEDSLPQTDAQMKLSQIKVLGPTSNLIENSDKLQSMNDFLQPKIASVLKEAEDCFERHDFDRAIILWDKALVLSDGEQEIKVLRRKAEAYLFLTDFESCILLYKKLATLCPTFPEITKKLAFVYGLKAKTLSDLHNFSAALEAYSLAIDLNPQCRGYKIGCVSCLSELGRHDESLALVNKMLETDIKNADLFILRARLHLIFTNAKLAYFDIKDALAIDADHDEAKKMFNEQLARADELKSHGIWLQLRGLHREAIRKFTVAIETNPEMGDYHILRGALERKLCEYNQAIDDFLLAMDKCGHNENSQIYIKAQKQLILTYNDFGVECFKIGNYTEAVSLLNKAIKAEKNEKGLYINRGDCFYHQQLETYALEDYKQALEIDPTDESIVDRIAQVHFDAAILNMKKRQYVAATENLTEALACNPLSALYYFQRARCRFMNSDTKGSRFDILTALHLNPNLSEASSLLMRLFPGVELREIMELPIASAVRTFIEKVINDKNLSSFKGL